MTGAANGKACLGGEALGVVANLDAGDDLGDVPGDPDQAEADRIESGIRVIGGPRSSRKQLRRSSISQ